MVRALVELPLEARIIGLSTLVGIHTSIDQELFMEALQPRLALLLPPQWDSAVMQSEFGEILLAALREMSLKRFPSIAAVAFPVMRFLGKWLDQLPQGPQHALNIERTGHHVQVMLTVQSLFWLAKDNAPSKRAFVQEFVARGFITKAEFGVLEQHPNWCMPDAGLCFPKLNNRPAPDAGPIDSTEYTRPHLCALV